MLASHAMLKRVHEQHTPQVQVPGEQPQEEQVQFGFPQPPGILSDVMVVEVFGMFSTSTEVV